MFALIKDNKIIGFLVEESQKAPFDSMHSFIEFAWDLETQGPPMITDFSVEGGQLIYPKPTGGNA